MPEGPQRPTYRFRAPEMGCFEMQRQSSPRLTVPCISTPISNPFHVYRLPFLVCTSLLQLTFSSSEVQCNITMLLLCRYNASKLPSLRHGLSLGLGLLGIDGLRGFNLLFPTLRAGPSLGARQCSTLSRPQTLSDPDF